MPKRIQRYHFKAEIRPLYALAILSLSVSAANAASGDEQIAQVQFNDAFLQQMGTSGVDVRRFEKGNVAEPGVYRADVYVNQRWLGLTPVTLEASASGHVEPCVGLDLLERMGVDLSKFSAEATALLNSRKGVCAPLPQFIESATASFDNGEQRLDITIPQASLSNNARGYVDAKYWDEGITAAVLAYNANVYRTDSGGNSFTQGYVGLNVGVNVGPWRFRHQGNLTTSTGVGTHYQQIQTTLERSIAPLKSKLTFGDGFTDGAMFDSFGFRGVQLASDDRMYPESQRGYAPTIRGVARSNARVQVTQNGNTIYETNVAPGPFEFNDLYPTGYGGNLQVIVTEADGSQSMSTVPFAAAPNALRPGVTRFSATVGQYRSATIDSKPMLFQGTVQHGFTNLITGYGGITAAQGYVAGVLGTALNTKVGAFGFDVTQANTSFPGHGSHNGQSLRLSYSKYFEPTSTNIGLAAYRFSSGGFYNLEDAIAMRDQRAQNIGTQRNALQLTLNQTLPGGWGSVYLTGTAQNYWNQQGTNTQFQAGYTNNFKRINYGVSLSRQYQVTNSKWDNRVMVTASIPLGNGSNAPFSSTSIQRDSDGLTSVQQTLSGTLGEDNAFAYGVNAGYNGGGNMNSATNVGGNVSYLSPMAALSAGASTGNGFNQFNGGVSGGVVAYKGGVVFAPVMGETMAIVEAKDAAGARITSQSGLRVDPWGRALVSTLRPFASNELVVDPKGLPVSVELKSTSKHIAPTAGAVSLVKFETDNPGASLIIRSKMADGEPVPFGADVFDAAGQTVGTVAQGGRVIVRGLKSATGDLTVGWGDGTNRQSCRVSYSLPNTPDARAKVWTTIDADCVTP
ncbi:outer membrane usher protein [Paraburkholderia fungorum]|uniref:Outer membrane usher protein n=1 Tax=Paraburkholderia fungorum TaxID=134537 RepID=A0A1H1J0Z2_9BURK|nr:fimbria/pilus outer membrane usher protein [Paraburkholderia fungorum]SDR43198.1 outer membrane usher protein [Paraburkholderia fungorum]